MATNRLTVRLTAAERAVAEAEHHLKYISHSPCIVTHAPRAAPERCPIDRARRLQISDNRCIHTEQKWDVALDG